MKLYVTLCSDLISNSEGFFVMSNYEIELMQPSHSCHCKFVYSLGFLIFDFLSFYYGVLYDEMQIESKFVLTTKLSVEGPLRMKEEYAEGILESPTVIEETVPEQLKGALGQAVNAMQQMPVPIRDAIASGLTIPLSKLFFKWTNEPLKSKFKLIQLINQS